MSDLSNLYISQSYKGIINLSDSTEGITGQTDYELQDGLGNGIGVSILSGSLLVDNDISSSTLSGIGNVETYSASVDLRLDEVEATASDHDGRVEQLEIYTSSLRDAFSVSGTNTDFKGDVTISGSLTAYTIHTITESASVIFSSGSNQLGDEPSDTQIFSGSVYVPNLHYLGTSSIDTNTRLNQIVQDALPSSWTGSVFLPFSSSVSQQIDALELFSQSLVLDTASFQLWTGSVFEPFSASVDSRLLAQQAEIIDLQNDANTHATTGSNNFFGSQSIDGDVTITGSVVIDGNQQITGSTNQLGNVNLIGNIEQTGSQFVSGSLTLEGTLRVETSASINGGWAVTGSSYYSGSVKGNVIFDSSSTQDPSDFTHSIDCNLGNFFDFYLLNGENRIYAQNMSGGETITVRLNQPGGTGSYGDIVWDTGSIKFPFTNGPTPTQGSEAIDILTLVSFDTGSLFGVLGKNYL